jgi:hypothetical protein
MTRDRLCPGTRNSELEKLHAESQIIFLTYSEVSYLLTATDLDNT